MTLNKYLFSSNGDRIHNPCATTGLNIFGFICFYIDLYCIETFCFPEVLVPAMFVLYMFSIFYCFSFTLYPALFVSILDTLLIETFKYYVKVLEIAG